MDMKDSCGAYWIISDTGKSLRRGANLKGIEAEEGTNRESKRNGKKVWKRERIIPLVK